MEKIFEDAWPEIRSDEQLQELIAKYPFIEPAYINVATSFMLKRQKSLLEKMWTIFQPYADSKFTAKIRRKGEFFGRSWEMAVAVALLGQSRTLVPRDSKKGPDIKIRSASPIWVEAVACTPGIGPDAVPNLMNGRVMDLPVEEIVLRIGNAITTKLRKYENYLASGIVKTGEPFVIAVSKGSIEHLDPHPPAVLRYLYGIGDQALRFPISVATGERTGEPPSSFFTRQEPIRKRGGEAVPVAFFEDPANAAVSAVIYCHNHIFNHPEPLGTDFVLLRNPNASTPLPDSFFSLGAEWVPEDDHLVYHEKQFTAHGNAFDYLEEPA